MTPGMEEDFKNGMRRLAGAVHLVTTSDGAEHQGLTATAVCSLTVDPPTLVVCVNRSASAHDAIVSNGVFAVNVLSRQQQDLAQLFSDTTAIEKRFQVGEWSSLVTGAPVLLGSLCNFDCRLQESVQQSTHTLFIGSVVGVTRSDENAPLMYFDGGYATISSVT